MPVTVLTGAALVGLALGLIAWLVAAATDPVRRLSVAHLNRGVVQVAASEVGSLTGERHDGLGRLARRLVPDPAVRLLDKLHARAGRPAAWPVDRLLVLKLLYVPYAVFSDAVLINVLSQGRPLFIISTVGSSIITFFLPELLLYNVGIKRRERIQKELADTLDQMTIAVEAGLGFDAAMARAAGNGAGPLSQELSRTLQDIQMGQSRRQAFEALVSRSDATDLRRFVRAVLQADAYGISLGDVLRTQAGDMRLRRRQNAERKAQQVPVKVIFPLMVCILPVLFIVVMGPAAVGIVQMFSQM